MTTAPTSSGELKVVPSTCTECSVHCGSRVHVRDGVVEDVKPNPAHPLSKGAFCLKGLKGSTGITYSDRRLLYPLRRVGERGEGKWQRISWDEALDYAAEGFAAVRETHGPLALIGACNNVYFGRGLAVVMLLRSLGSPKLDDQSGSLRRLPCGQPALHRARYHARRHCLVAISGNVDRLGGNRRVKKPKGFLDNLQLVHDAKFRLPREIEEQTLGADKFPLWAGPRGWQTACHNPTAIDAILTGKPYPVRAMYVSGANIVVTYPNTPKTVEALRSLDFLMVASDAMTPTAELADLVVPKTTGLEEDEIRLQPGGPLIAMTQAVVPPRGEARNDFAIARGLLAKMQARGAAIENFLPWQSQDEFIEYLLGDSGVTLQTLRRDGFAVYPYALENFDKFPSPTGKLELYSEAIASIGVDPLPNFSTPARDAADTELKAAFPLTLLTGDREKTYHHSRFRDQPWAKKISPDPRLLIHPTTAREMAVADQQWVRIKTPGARGSCKAKIKISENTPEGVVSTGMGWWRPGSMAPGSGAFDVNINAAMTYDGPWDPISGSVDSRGILCRIVAV